MQEQQVNRDAAAIAEASAFKAIVHMHPESIFVVADDGEVLYANHSGTRLLGRLVPPGRGVPGVLNLPAGHSNTATLRGLAGCDLVLAAHSRPVTWNSHSARMLYVSDVTDCTRQQESLERLAYYDGLTGLYNRRGLELVAEHHCLVAARSRRDVVGLFIDLDGLKQINDRYGHHTGDQAIVELADVIRAASRDADIKARIGGDEFVVLVSEDSASAIDILLTRIRAEVDRRNASSGRSYTLSMSIGIARHGPEKRCDMGKLLGEADSSMYRAKRQRDGRPVRHFDGRGSASAAGVTTASAGPERLFQGLMPPWGRGSPRGGKGQDIPSWLARTFLGRRKGPRCRVQWWKWMGPSGRRASPMPPEEAATGLRRSH